MATVIETILKSAEAYPDRPAIITTDKVVTLYRDLGKVLVPDFGLALMTSGTTKSPKKIEVDQEQLKRKVARFERVRGAAYKDLRSIFMLPGLVPPVAVHNALSMFLRGGTVFHVHGMLDAKRDMDVFQEHQVEGISFIPKVDHYWRYLELGHGYRFPRVFVHGGAVTREQLRQIKAGLARDHLWVVYAAAEVGPIAGGPLEDVADVEGCVGRVLGDVEVEIDGGQVRVRSDSMAPGYADDAGLTTKNFKGGWFYPGDRGHFERGMLCIDGRV